MGPDTTQPASIRYANVGTYNGGQIDLVVGSECVYYDGCAAIVATLLHMLAPDGQAVFMMASTRAGLVAFADALTGS